MTNTYALIDRVMRQINAQVDVIGAIQQWRIAKPIADLQEQVTEWQIFFKIENIPWFSNKSSRLTTKKAQSSLQELLLQPTVLFNTTS